MRLKMISHISFCCLSAILAFSLATAKPVSNLSNLQSLTQLLAEESNAPYFALLGEKAAGAQQKSAASDAADQEEPPWDAEDETNSALEGGDKVEDGLARFLKDIMRTPKRSWSRYKKGGLRSCFGVRMERIGSFAGLGC